VSTQQRAETRRCSDPCSSMFFVASVAGQEDSAHSSSKLYEQHIQNFNKAHRNAAAKPIVC